MPGRSGGESWMGGNGRPPVRVQGERLDLSREIFRKLSCAKLPLSLYAPARLDWLRCRSPPLGAG